MHLTAGRFGCTDNKAPYKSWKGKLVSEHEQIGETFIMYSIANSNVGFAWSVEIQYLYILNTLENDLKNSKPVAGT